MSGNRKHGRAPVGTTANENNPKPGFKSQEKTSLGGKYNSGVTSGNAAEKKQIEQKASMLDMQPGSFDKKENDKKTRKQS